jgi:Outer membrane protein beta-barrel domain
MNCRILLLTAALLFFISFANAQIHWAVKAGAQISYASYKKDGSKISTSTVAGFNAGITGKIYFDENVAFVSGLQYSAKGYEIKTMPADPIKKYRLNYIELPVMLQFDLPATTANKFYCKVGPSIGIGLSGKETYTTIDGTRVSNNVILSVTGNYFGLFDASLNFFAGYTYKGILFAEAGFAYGIGNINNDMDGPVIKTRVPSVSIGYLFR